MMERRDPTVIGICGSLRDTSRTRIAVSEALAASAQAGASVELVDLRSYELPSLNATDTEVPDATEFQETVKRADSVLLATPNYHGSYSGALKNALDYCGRDEFAETTVGLLEVAAGTFPGSALIHLRTVSRTLRAWTLPTEVAIPDSHSLITDSGIQDADLAERTRRLGRELVTYAGVAAYPESNLVASTDTTTQADD
ncbi:MAG: NADPH-dependent FMN reductase [Halobacteriales archaeon]